MSKSSLVVGFLTLALAVVYVELRLSPVEPEPAGEPPDLARLEDRIVGRVERMLEEREAERTVPPPPSTDLRPAAASPEPAAPGEAPEPAPVPKSERAKRAAAMLAKLETGRFTTDEIDELWDTLSGSGLEDRAVAAFRSYLEDRPEDPDGWYGLGVALTSKFLGGAVSQLEVMKLSAEADKAFTKALELDDHHFSARLSKAISYTFYPPIAGKSPEAIEHFETLVRRHGTDTSIEEMEEVYFNLGNEYLKIGNVEKARASYRNGIRYFPDSERIRGALEAMEKR